MSKKKNHARHAVRPPPRYPSTSPSRDADFWAPLDAYNNLPAPQRSEALKSLGIIARDPAIHGILTKSHFVIPGKTRFACQRCGECCRYARKVAQLTYDPCPFLTADNSCAKHNDRYLVCKWFPFWIFNDPNRGPLLTIKPYCSGYGHGAAVDYTATLERISALALTESTESDGAFVIHEVLIVPGRNDWAFPSKTNVDALMAHIHAETRKAAVEQSLERPEERSGEVHYAHHYTSGLLGGINSPLLTINEKSVITDANQTACELFKRDRRLVVGKPFPSFFVNPERVASSVTACFSRGRETASPQRLRLPDESATPVLLNGLVFRDRGDGLVHGALVCVNPVSAAVFSEVNQSHTYARGLLEASLDALMVIDMDGAIADVNEAAVGITGQSRETLIGSPFQDLFINREKAGQGVELTFKQGSVRNYELMLRDAASRTIPVSFNATVYRDAEGTVQGIFAAARDIRERLAMVRELEEAKNYSRGLIECCIDLMVTIDRAGMITDANNAALGMTGRPRPELIGAPFGDFFDDPARARAGVELTFTNGEVRNYQINLLTAARKTVPVVFNATLYRNASGEVQGVFAIARPRE
jgi:PAS domain S-box-containing protein